MRLADFKKVTDSYLQELWHKAVKASHDKHLEMGNFGLGNAWLIHLNKVPDDAKIDWFGMKPVNHSGHLILLPAPNLCVNTGVHIFMQRGFGLTATGGTVADIIDTGGVDNNTTAVAATTTQFDTTASNRFLTAFDATPTYSTANKRVTALFNITNTDTTIVHRRYGLSTDTANAANTLATMLSGFILDFNGKAYDITVESQTNGTGS